MCGRFFLRPSVAEILAMLEAGADDDLGLTLPQWNVAPTQPVLAAYRTELGDRRVGTFRWGLVPSWWKDAKLPVLVNARGEDVATKPSFRGPFRSRRVLVPISGFYEWRGNARARTAVAVGAAAGETLVLAGVSDVWWGRGEPLRSLAIVTCASSPSFAAIHDRQPVVLPKEAWAAWLDPRTPPADAQALLRASAEPFEVVDVGREVNDHRHTDGAWLPERWRLGTSVDEPRPGVVERDA